MTNVGMKVGSVMVQTTDNGGHSVDFHLDKIMNRLIHISEAMPDPIKAQALAYREALRAVIRDGMVRAIASHDTTIIARLEMAGMSEAASIVKKT